jgi:hypothetical protein
MMIYRLIVTLYARPHVVDTMKTTMDLHNTEAQQLSVLRYADCGFISLLAVYTYSRRRPGCVVAMIVMILLAM